MTKTEKVQQLGYIDHYIWSNSSRVTAQEWEGLTDNIFNDNNFTHWSELGESVLDEAIERGTHLVKVTEKYSMVPFKHED